LKPKRHARNGAGTPSQGEGGARERSLQAVNEHPARHLQRGIRKRSSFEENEMTYVVTENCIRCKYTDCVEVCPADCFHEGPNFLVINPETCIDCSLCAPECPADAIFADNALPEGQQHFLELNAELAEVWPVITQSASPLAEAETWVDQSGKLAFLER